ncbi:hypothetical protein [Algicella marina]|uniref:Uncharacterized protein n=1 Tax=Algicella marina TaxID=2683284 RepID=A0A6P1SYY7_9RHOB|nr:hypothetical protein [Algicella marina]QHQ34957.1 hypothetical protein GO499_06975 [Algicella marina]
MQIAIAGELVTYELLASQSDNEMSRYANNYALPADRNGTSYGTLSLSFALGNDETRERELSVAETVGDTRVNLLSRSQPDRGGLAITVNKSQFDSEFFTISGEFSGQLGPSPN